MRTVQLWTKGGPFSGHTYTYTCASTDTSTSTYTCTCNTITTITSTTITITTRTISIAAARVEAADAPISTATHPTLYVADAIPPCRCAWRGIPLAIVHRERQPEEGIKPTSCREIFWLLAEVPSVHSVARNRVHGKRLHPMDGRGTFSPCSGA
jgi:hypothetical protein